MLAQIELRKFLQRKSKHLFELMFFVYIPSKRHFKFYFSKKNQKTRKILNSVSIKIIFERPKLFGL